MWIYILSLLSCFCRVDRGKSQSEPDLITAFHYPYWNVSGFPPGITVDELFLYRKKRSPGKFLSHLIKKEKTQFPINFNNQLH